MQKAVRVLNYILMVLAMACLVYYINTGGLWLKGVTSSWFVLLGLVNLVFAKRSGVKKMGFLAVLEGALVLCMTADVCLGLNFLLGTAVFALGHVCFFAAFCILEKPRHRDWIPIGIILVISLIAVLGTPYIQIEDPLMRGILVAYAIVISAMLGKAIGNLMAKRSLSRWLFAIGSVMFWFSDLMLALNLFGSGGRLAGLLCMYTYWPGQSLIAHTLYHYAVEEREP